MTVSAVSQNPVPTMSGPARSTPAGSSPPTSSNPNGLAGSATQGMQQFFQLLVAQLKNQDPLQPMDNTQFVTQLAQFTTLQTLQSIQSSLQSSIGAQLLGEAMSFIGRSVTAQPSGGPPVTGTVKGVRLQGTDVLLDLGSTTVSLSDVQAVKAATNGG